MLLPPYPPTVFRPLDRGFTSFPSTITGVNFYNKISSGMYVRICLCVCVHVHVYANVYVYVLLILFLWRTVTLLYPPTAEHTSFSSSHGSLTRKDHILSHEVHLNKSNSLVIIQSMLSDYKGIKLDISNCKVVEKSPNICRLNKTLLKNNCVNKETSKEIKKCETII